MKLLAGLVRRADLKKPQGRPVKSTDPRKNVVKQFMFRRCEDVSKLTSMTEVSPGVFQACLLRRANDGTWINLGVFELDAANCENAGAAR